MPAAPLRERRGSSRSRAKASADRVRSRVTRTAAQDAPRLGTSKLRAARQVGLKGPVAGVAAALIGLMILVATFATGGRAAELSEAARRVANGAANIAGEGRALVDGRFAGLGFRVGDVHLQGASKASQAEILRAAAIRPGEPILALDLNAIRARVESVGWVERARVIRLLPDTLVIAVDQRPLMAIWEHQGHRDVVAADGRVVTSVDPNHFRQLPRIIGLGANTDAAAFLPQLEARPRLTARLQAIRRVDSRRWDLLLKNGAVVLLPAEDEAAAMRRLDALDRAAKVLDLNLDRIDLRKSNFTVIRPKVDPTPAAVSHGV